VHASEDLGADTFIAAYRAIGRYRPTGAPLYHWLLRIAMNKANRWARTRRRQAQPTADGTIPEAGTPRRDHRTRTAREALLALPPRHQEAVSLHYLEGLSIEEAARVVGCRPGTIKSRLARAREAMRRRIERWEGDQ
jgi:RNA polymerase sigma-70 factor (ECF subfamily)